MGDGDPPDGRRTAVLAAVADAFERWFDVPDRPPPDDDVRLVDGWLAHAAAAGLPGPDAVEVVGEVLTRQFQRLARKIDELGIPASLAVIDRDVRQALDRAATAAAKPSAVADDAPAPWTGHLSAIEYRSWIQPCHVAVTGKTATITAPTAHTAEWVRTRLEPHVRAALGVTAVEVTVAQELAR